MATTVEQTNQAVRDGRRAIVLLLLSSFAVTVPISLSPILLGALVARGRLTATELGQAATAELLAMALTTLAAGALLRPARIRVKAIAAGLGLTLANVAMLMVDHHAVLAARALSGCCFGILMWILTCFLIRAPDPARSSGIFTLCQAGLSLILSSAATSINASTWGVDGSYCLLAGVSALIMLASLTITDGYPPIPGAAVRGFQALPTRGLIGLVIIFLYLAGIIGVWVYAGARATQAGLSPTQTGTAITIALAAQFGGATMATWLGGRVPSGPVVIGGGVVLVLAATEMSLSASMPLFFAAAAIFGMVWMFVTPLFMPFMLGIDPTARSAMYALPCQMLGAAAGPVLASHYATPGNVAPSMLAATALVGIATILALLATMPVGQRRHQT